MPKKKTKKTAKKKIVKKTAREVTKQVSQKSGNNLAIAIVSLVMNLLIPGLGSIIGGKIKQGIWQLVLLFGSLIIGISLIITIIGLIPGILLIIFGPTAAWIWGIVTGIILIKDASE